jgi:hypothetical protein
MSEEANLIPFINADQFVSICHLNEKINLLNLSSRISQYNS